MKKPIGYKKFLSPAEIKHRFNLTREEYQSLVMAGLPVYHCAGISRHSIDEVYMWCEENAKEITDESAILSKSSLARFLGTSEDKIKKMEECGMPYINKKIKGSGVFTTYNKYDVIEWLRKQSCGVKA